MSTTRSTASPPTAPPNLSLIYVISFLDLFAVSLIIPIFTTVYKSLNLDPITFGLVSSVYGLAQFLCNPVIGRLSDQYGRKSLLLVSFLGSAVGTALPLLSLRRLFACLLACLTIFPHPGAGYLLLGAATTVWMLFLSRVVVGVVKQTLTITQAWITAHCPLVDDRMRVRI
jgi:MFS family permease